MQTVCFLVPLLIATALAIPVEDGGLSRYSYRTSSFSDFDGNTVEDSYSNEGAALNDEPLYIVTNEGRIQGLEGQVPDVREAYDFYNPMENLHEHKDMINGLEDTFVEPLENENDVYMTPEMLNNEMEEIETIPRDPQEIPNVEIDPLNDEVVEEIVVPDDLDYDRDYY